WQRPRRRTPRNEDSRDEPPNRGRTSKVQHRTPNAEVKEDSRCHSMFDVGCSSGLMEHRQEMDVIWGHEPPLVSPLPALSPPCGERVAEGRERGGGGIFFLKFRPGFMNETGVRRGLHCSSWLLVVALVLPSPLARAQLE